MRIVRVQVYAREKYRSTSGFFDIRSVTLEAEIESSDGETGAIWDLQRQADRVLESWIDEHRFVEPEDPMLGEAPTTVPTSTPVEPVPF
jgi:hypothetical protein